MGSKPSIRSLNIWGRMVLLFFEPKKAISMEYRVVKKAPSPRNLTPQIGIIIVANYIQMIHLKFDQ